LRAALVEAARTQLVCVAVAVTGLTVVSPFVLAAYRGVVGGVVSVDDNHVSRLLHRDQAVYYLSVVVLQIIPYALAGGAGVRLGLAYLQRRPEEHRRRWLGVPKGAIGDLVRILIFILPFVLAANLWEYLSPLNR
jgi:TRAP-type mannitol/chloroaromatic compound transport system permease small subunit